LFFADFRETIPHFAEIGLCCWEWFRPMVFDNILKLQKQLTDKYVVVDASRPELKRFDGLTGMVKTVNFSGRALVQFDGYNNIGWYDIDPMFLKVVDEPIAKPEGKLAKHAKGDGGPSSVQEDKAASPVKPVVAKGKASAADILAAARTGAKPPAAGTAAAPITPPPKPAEKSAAKPAGKMSAADILAAARGKAPVPTAPKAEAPTPVAEPAKPAAAKVDVKKMSPADILAAARGKAPAAAAPAAPAPAAKAPAAKAPPPPKAEKPAPAKAPEPAPEPEPAPPAASSSGNSSGGKAKSMKDAFKTMDEIIAYLRK
jgi:hypothetical protein